MVLCHIKLLASDRWKNEPKGDEEAFETPIQSNAPSDGDHHEALHPRPGVVRRLLAESCVDDIQAQPPAAYEIRGNIRPNQQIDVSVNIIAKIMVVLPVER